MASMNFGGQKFQKFCLKAENFEKFLDFGFREGGGYSLYVVRPTRSHMNSTPMEKSISMPLQYFSIYLKVPAHIFTTYAVLGNLI